MNSKVALVACGSYDQVVVSAAVRRAVDLVGGIGAHVKPAERIVLKPNCLYGVEPAKCTTTHPAVFRAVALLCKEAGAEVQYGDSPSVGTSDSGMRLSGFGEVADELGLTLADFDRGRSVNHPNPLSAKSFVLANGVLHADGLISLPKLKTHGLTRFTGAVKNQYGCIPGFLKSQYHGRFPVLSEFAGFIVDLNTFIRPRLFIMDAVIAMEGNGPGNGNPRALGCILISADPVALDAVACRIINLDPEFVPTTLAGERAGLGVWRSDQIEIIGDPLEQFVCSTFVVARKPYADIMRGSKVKSAVLNQLVDRPVIVKSKCIKCGKCVEICPTEPKSVDWIKSNKKRSPRHDYNRCIRCFCCQEVCPANAIIVKTPFAGALAGRFAMALLSGYRTIRGLAKRK